MSTRFPHFSNKTRVFLKTSATSQGKPAHRFGNRQSQSGIRQNAATRTYFLNKTAKLLEKAGKIPKSQRKTAQFLGNSGASLANPLKILEFPRRTLRKKPRIHRKSRSRADFQGDFRVGAGETRTFFKEKRVRTRAFRAGNRLQSQVELIRQGNGPETRAIAQGNRAEKGGFPKDFRGNAGK